MRLFLRLSLILFVILQVSISFPLPEKAKAADGDLWQAASNLGFGTGSITQANKLLSFGDMLMVSTNNQIYFTNGMNFPDNQKSLQGATNAMNLKEFPGPSDTRFVYAGRSTANGGRRMDYYDPLAFTTPLYWEDAKFPLGSCMVNGRSGKNEAVSATIVFGDYLYAGTNNPICGAQIWRLSKYSPPYAPTWENVFIDGGTNRGYYAVQHLFIYKDKLYVSFLNSNTTSCHLARSSTGDFGSWDDFQVTGLYPNGTKCINTSAVVFDLLWVGTKANLYPYTYTLYRSADGENYSPWVPGCILEINGTVCGGSSYMGNEVTSLTTNLDRQLVIGTENGMVLRGCPSHFNGSNIALYPSKGPEAGYKVNDIVVHKNHMFVSLGRKNPNDTTLGKVIVTTNTVDNLHSFIRSDPENCGPREPATMQIELPSAQVFIPNELRRGADVLTFSPAEPCFKIGNSCNNYQAEVSLVGANAIDRHYVIKVKNMQRDYGDVNLDFGHNDHTWGIRLTFKEPVASTTISSIAASLRNNPQGLSHTFLGDDDCRTLSDPFAATKLCFKEKISLFTPTERPGAPNGPEPLTPQYLVQSVDAPVSDTNVKGNVMAFNNVNDFRIQANALAVGRTVTVRDGSQLNYSPNVFDWDSVNGKLSSLYTQGFNKGVDVSSSRLNNGIYNRSLWNLNAILSDPDTYFSSSFSNPPEGKIWKINGNLRINNQLTFRGSGTIVVSGEVQINNKIICETNTRLAIISNSSNGIKFNSTNGRQDVGCGAYLALNGPIIFADTGEGDLTGIFVAKGNIDLPARSSLIGPYFINYDSTFAKNPTALFKEILSTIYYSTS